MALELYWSDRFRFHWNSICSELAGVQCRPADFPCLLCRGNRCPRTVGPRAIWPGIRSGVGKHPKTEGSENDFIAVATDTCFADSMPILAVRSGRSHRRHRLSSAGFESCCHHTDCGSAKKSKCRSELARFRDRSYRRGTVLEIIKGNVARR